MSVAPSSGRKPEAIIKFFEKNGGPSLSLSQLQKYLSMQYPKQGNQTMTIPPELLYSDTSANKKCNNERGGNKVQLWDRET